MLWRTNRRVFDLSQHGLIMGVLNVTPDSFSDGGRYFSSDLAVAHARSLITQGADIIDVGGESTRPGAEPVTEAEELRRVIPVIRAIRAHSDIPISIDTLKAGVAHEALAEGAEILNDVTALCGDPAMCDVAVSSGAGLVLMHMQGRPRTMQKAPHYHDVLVEVADFLKERLTSVLARGIAADQVVLDPGIGFGKSVAHNISLLKGTATLCALGRPVLIGVSRKSLLAALADAPGIDERFWPAVALTSYCRERGARIFRVHEPLPHHDALRMTEAILAG